MKKTLDRDVWVEHVRKSWNAPLTKEQKDEIDSMSEAELADFFFSMTGSNAQRNYSCAKILENGVKND